jgi:hypothetical protein
MEIKNLQTKLQSELGFIIHYTSRQGLSFLSFFKQLRLFKAYLSPVYKTGKLFYIVWLCSPLLRYSRVTGMLQDNCRQKMAQQAIFIAIKPVGSD